MFVDASAIIAILTREPEAGSLADRLDQAATPITSAMAIFESTLGLSRKARSTVAEAEADIAEFLAKARVTPVAITPADAETALEAFARFGKGQGHPAQLNMGDCFAYAVARRHRAPLLFKGDDFIHTDIAPA